MSKTTCLLGIERIRTDGGTQMRVSLNEDAVAELAAVLRDGGVIRDPIVVFRDAAGEHWLADGFHRVEAHRRAAVPQVDAEVHEGSQRDARLYAIGANAAHGVRRTNADKRRAVMALLGDEEWRGWSQGILARKANVTQPFVSKVIAEFAPTHNGYESPPKTGLDGRVTNTANIGRKPAAKPVPRWECSCGYGNHEDDAECGECGVAREGFSVDAPAAPAAEDPPHQSRAKSGSPRPWTQTEMAGHEHESARFQRDNSCPGDLCQSDGEDEGFSRPPRREVFTAEPEAPVAVENEAPRRPLAGLDEAMVSTKFIAAARAFEAAAQELFADKPLSAFRDQRFRDGCEGACMRVVEAVAKVFPALAGQTTKPVFGVIQGGVK